MAAMMGKIGGRVVDAGRCDETGINLAVLWVIFVFFCSNQIGIAVQRNECIWSNTEEPEDQ